MQTWTILVAEEANSLTFNVWERVCDLAERSKSLPGLILKGDKKISICIPMYVRSEGYPISNKLMAVIPIEEWIEKWGEDNGKRAHE